MGHNISEKNSQRQVQSVSEITAAVKELLETHFREVWIQGEISNFKRQSSGHLYFSLKDSHAQIGAVMFRGSAGKLKTMPKDGDKVMVRAELNVYAPRGSYQLVVRELHWVGVGELLQRLEELKREIHKRGWFKPEHKKPLPQFPRRIGVITSPTGAAVRDILNVLGRRHAGLHVIVNPVRVQGVEAPGEIAQAIRQFNTHKMVDVMIVGRGGGSLEDLWAFNEEAVAKEIFESQIPVICAVGHETDHCIAEYVADVRAPTPSAAAEIVTAEKTAQLDFLATTKERLARTLQHRAAHARARLERFSNHPALLDPYYLIGHHMQRLDEVKVTLNHQIRSQLQAAKLELTAIGRHLHAINPKGLLAQGYSILFSETMGSVISSVSDLAPKMGVKALLSDGEVSMTVND